MHSHRSNNSSVHGIENCKANKTIPQRVCRVYNTFGASALCVTGAMPLPQPQPKRSDMLSCHLWSIVLTPRLSMHLKKAWFVSRLLREAVLKNLICTVNLLRSGTQTETGNPAQWYSGKWVPAENWLYWMLPGEVSELVFSLPMHLMWGCESIRNAMLFHPRAPRGLLSALCDLRKSKTTEQFYILELQNVAIAAMKNGNLWLLHSLDLLGYPFGTEHMAFVEGSDDDNDKASAVNAFLKEHLPAFDPKRHGLPTFKAAARCGALTLLAKAPLHDADTALSLFVHSENEATQRFLFEGYLTKEALSMLVERTPRSAQRMMEAIAEVGSRSWLYEVIDRDFLTVDKMDTCLFAARTGNLPMLNANLNQLVTEYVALHDTQATCLGVQAAKGGHVAAINAMRELHGLSMDLKYVLNMACWGGKENVVRACASMDKSGDLPKSDAQTACGYATDGYHLHIVQFLASPASPWKVEISKDFQEFGRLILAVSKASDGDC